MQTQKGFTLIELLVVIAIIGILAGMVVVNMSSAPDAAKNAKLQSYMDQLRTAATVFSTTQASPTYVGFDGSGDGKLLADKITALPTTYNSSSTATAFCAKAKYLGSATTTYWCIDSTNGYSGTATSGVCTGLSISCL
jgi:prepilin-type N-terminal cleavage/methylation domain-containing protein